MLPNGKISVRIQKCNRKELPVEICEGQPSSGLWLVKVKRRGKSSPVPVATQEAVHLMG